MREQAFRYRGAYHWLRSDSSIAVQAANLCARIDALGGLQPGEFVQADWEVTPNIPLVTSNQVAEWCDRVEQHYGRECVIVYSSDWLPDSTLDTDSRAEFAEWRDENPDYPLWFANYNTGSRPTGGWAECDRYGADVWQWTSTHKHPSIISPRRVVDLETGKTVTVDGGFDMNHIFNPAVLDRLCALSTTPQPIPPIVPEEDDMAVRYFKFAPLTTPAPLFASGDGVTAVWVDDEQHPLMPVGAIESVPTSVAKRYTFVGGNPPEGCRGIWANA
jgi:hypothetical protein